MNIHRVHRFTGMYPSLQEDERERHFEGETEHGVDNEQKAVDLVVETLSVEVVQTREEARTSMVEQHHLLEGKYSRAMGSAGEVWR